MDSWIPKEDLNLSEEANYESEPNKKLYKKDYKKRQYKKKELRDFDVNPITDVEKVKMLKRCENIILWHVARREMSAKMVRQKLENKKEFPKEVIDEAISKAIFNQWIDDARFAENFVASKVKYDKLGKNAIKQKLALKGIDSEIISESLSDINPEIEFNAAIELAKKALSKTIGLPKEKRVQRALGLLARKGYSSHDSYKAINLVLQEEKDESLEYYD